MPRPNEPARIEIITGHKRRRRYSAEHKLRLVAEMMQSGMTVSAVARLHGVSPSLLFKWKRPMSGGKWTAVRADEDVVGSSRVLELEVRVRDLERLLGGKTLEVEVLKEATAAARRENQAASCRRRHREVPMKVEADTLGVARSNLIERDAGIGEAAGHLPASGRRRIVASYRSVDRRTEEQLLGRRGVLTTSVSSRQRSTCG